MNIYTISDDIYFQNGIISLARTKGWHIASYELESILSGNLNFEDVVILHLDARNSSCAKAISQLSNTCKLLVVLGTPRNIIVNGADEVIKSRDSLSEIIKALSRIVKKKKRRATGESSLSDIEKVILKESLKGKGIHLIANALNIPPKKVYAYRNKACKKLGGKKINDLLLIRDKLFEEPPVFITPFSNIRLMAMSL